MVARGQEPVTSDTKFTVKLSASEWWKIVVGIAVLVGGAVWRDAAIQAKITDQERATDLHRQTVNQQFQHIQADLTRIETQLIRLWDARRSANGPAANTNG